MSLVRIKRDPVFVWWFWGSIAAIIVTHAVLCHPAAICRGHPPLRPDELIMMFVAPFFAGLPALFDDRKEHRQSGVFALSVGMALVYGIVQVNFQSGRPSIGHLVGVVGIIERHPIMIVFFSIVPFIQLLVSLTYYERVAGDCWSVLRGFNEDDSDAETENSTKE